METLLTILAINWIIGIVFGMSVIIYGYNTNHDLLVMIGREIFISMLILGPILGIFSVISFFIVRNNSIKENKRFINELLDIPHRKDIDVAWLELVDPEYYKSLRYNIKKDGWASYLVLPMGIDREKLEKTERLYNNRKNDYFRPKTLSHLNNIN